MEVIMSKPDRKLRQLLSSYSVAGLSVGLAVVFTMLSGSAIKDATVLFFCSVMLTSWYGGLWPGVLAAVLSALALDYYFIPPLYALGVGSEDARDMIVFVATALFISWLNGDQKRAKASISKARDELETSVKERTADLKKVNQQLQLEIAERKTAEQRFLEAQTEIARIARITTMGELAASIAHEINQPLGSIVTTGDACLRWLKAQPPDINEAQLAVEAIIRDASRASNVVVRTRKLLRRGERLRESLDINEVINEVLNWLRVELQRNEIRSRLEMQEEVPPVIVDRVLLQQVVVNLVMNAIDAMRTVSDRMKELGVRTEQHDSNPVIVRVLDSGVGIDSDDMSRLFEAFYTTKAKGIGMGLTISRSIIEAHGGRLWAERNDGPGSTFCFTLPIGKEREA
jgi:C4-dicarboxylate-specific signal transduction histidine kinase